MRDLADEDLAAAWAINRLAFGPHSEPPPSALVNRPGRTTWGVYDEGGTLLATAEDREQGQWFGGRLVPTAGIAGVAVRPEDRGSGLGRLVLTRVLRAARDRGAVVSTLFPTTAAPYRSLGFETVGALTWQAIPTAALAITRPPTGVTLRPATEVDVPDILDTYRQVASGSTGLMERSGPLFDLRPSAVLGGHDGITVASGPSGVEGYVSWDRSGGYGAEGTISVPDLFGRTPAAISAMLAMLGSWASVAPTVLLRLPELDPVRLLHAMPGLRLHTSQPWMLRLVDAAAAVAARGWAPSVTGSVDLHLEDAECPWNAGAHRFVTDGGEARLEPGGTGAVHLGPRGLALVYAGLGNAALLRRAGLLTGGDASSDAFLSGVGAGPPPALLDYF